MARQTTRKRPVTSNNTVYDPEEFDTLIGLLREYTEKLSNSKRDRLNTLFPVVGDLARYASQLIEHADLGQLAQLELRLRLAEFEDALRG